MKTSVDFSGIEEYVSKNAVLENIQAASSLITRVFAGNFAPTNQLGWFSPSAWEKTAPLEQIKSLANKIRADADVLVLIGVGGSNRGAQSLVETIGDKKVQIIYAGNNLSTHALKEVLASIEGKSIYINNIAKDFNTLEPGIYFRFLRNYMEQRYGAAARERIIVTGSKGSGQLYELSRQYGYTWLPFPDTMSGRFSVISSVGLLPMAVAGIDIDQVIQGAIRAATELKNTPFHQNSAVIYAISRNMLFKKGFYIENMVTLEPTMFYFARWWAQLFAESEGKNQICIFPAISNYSEDLHAVGQYIQDGKRMLVETFLDARFYHPEIIIQRSEINDGFDYLNGKSFDELNTAVFEASYSAHKNDGVPCYQIRCGEINAEIFGELFYFFMLSCCISALLIGVDPFGQDGVEAYKQRMYSILGK
jgi:glucose-6-phosphate isomerase